MGVASAGTHKGPPVGVPLIDSELRDGLSEGHQQEVQVKEELELLVQHLVGAGRERVGQGREGEGKTGWGVCRVQRR